MCQLLRRESLFLRPENDLGAGSVGYCAVNHFSCARKTIWALDVSVVAP